MQITETQLRQAIRRMIKESIQEIANEKLNEEKEKKQNDSSTKTIRNSNVKVLRKRVIERLKDKTTDCAPYAYMLWPEKDKDNARSQFYKCRDGELNDNGDAYSFTDQEIVKIASMLTRTNL